MALERHWINREINEDIDLWPSLWSPAVCMWKNTSAKRESWQVLRSVMGTRDAKGRDFIVQIDYQSPSEKISLRSGQEEDVKRSRAYLALASSCLKGIIFLYWGEGQNACKRASKVESLILHNFYNRFTNLAHFNQNARANVSTRLAMSLLLIWRRKKKHGEHRRRMQS